MHDAAAAIGFTGEHLEPSVRRIHRASGGAPISRAELKIGKSIVIVRDRNSAYGRFLGDRYGMVVDPFGDYWSLATHTNDLSSAEIRNAADAVLAQRSSKDPSA